MTPWNEVELVRETWSRIIDLNDGWGGIGSNVKPHRSDIEYGMKLLDAVQRPYLQYPSIKANPDGSLSFEWRRNGHVCVISWRRDRTTDIAFDGAVTSHARPEFDALRDACDWHLAKLTATDTDQFARRTDHDSGSTAPA